MVAASKRDGSVSVAVIGAGSIGTAFAAVFASAGRQVRIQDPDHERLDAARSSLDRTLSDLDAHGLLDEAPSAILARVAFTSDPAEALSGAVWIQECAPENLELKQALLAELDRLADPDAVIASSTSTIPS
jgi:L-gulonate 3-dehydrogenase